MILIIKDANIQEFILKSKEIICFPKLWVYTLAKLSKVRSGSLIKFTSGRWNSKQSVWEYLYGKVFAAGLKQRIVSMGEKSV